MWRQTRGELIIKADVGRKVRSWVVGLVTERMYTYVKDSVVLDATGKGSGHLTAASPPTGKPPFLYLISLLCVCECGCGPSLEKIKGEGEGRGGSCNPWLLRVSARCVRGEGDGAEKARVRGEGMVACGPLGCPGWSWLSSLIFGLGQARVCGDWNSRGRGEEENLCLAARF